MKIMISEQDFQAFLEVYQKHPNSRVFAPLTDAYRERKQYQKALEIAERGVAQHPSYAGGWVALGRVYFDQGQWEPAIKAFIKATEADPENLLAFQLLGDAYVLAKDVQHALKAYKMSLLLNPQQEKLQKKVEKLETLTASDFEDEWFTEEVELVPLSNQKVATHHQGAPHSHTPGEEFVGPEGQASSPSSSELQGDLPVQKDSSPSKKETWTEFQLERELAYIDALLARGDSETARSRLEQALELFPAHPELYRRLAYFTPPPIPTPIRPLASRERQIIEKKRLRLEKLLQALRHKQESLMV